jgi:hypothetical protein
MSHVQIIPTWTLLFLEPRCLDGAAPKDLTPNLFMVARYKRRSVNTELNNFNLMTNLKDSNFVINYNYISKTHY